MATRQLVLKQAQDAGKAAFDVYLKAKQPINQCSTEAAKEAARTAKAIELLKLSYEITDSNFITSHFIKKFEYVCVSYLMS